MPQSGFSKRYTGKKRKWKVSDKSRNQIVKRLHKFQCSEDDHCETPGKAYDDVIPILRWYADKIGKNCETLAIYDPYFCNGAVVKNLNNRGFKNVYNKNEDFYAVVAGM